MSHWNRPMRQYHPIIPKCALCRKPMTASVFDAILNAYVHPYNCLAPTHRATKADRVARGFAE